jgi:hypothetical protein
MTTGFDKMQFPLVHVRCRRCHKSAGLFCADTSGAGAWQHSPRRRCRCDPPPQLPTGTELDGLVAQARRSPRSDGRAAVSLSR